MIDIAVVGEQLHGLGSVFRRKINADMVTTYHTVLDRKLDETQFIDACMSILEHETSFPSPAHILRYGSSWSRHRSEVGEPYIEGMRLESYCDKIQSDGDLPESRAQFKDVVERLEYEDAVIVNGGKPPETGDDNRLLGWIQTVAAKAESNLAEIAELERARHGG